MHLYILIFWTPLQALTGKCFSMFGCNFNGLAFGGFTEAGGLYRNSFNTISLNSPTTGIMRVEDTTCCLWG